ncbi:MAG: carbohydrate kinase family protein [Thermoplasmatota archaeon]
MNDFLGVFGHTAVDIILKVQKLPKPNSSIAVENRVTRYGGTGANIAKAASDLGVDTRLASFVGEDFELEYRRALEKSGVDTSDLLEVEGMKTPTCWIVSDEDEDQMAFIDQGAMEHAVEMDIQKGCVDNSEIIHIGTGRPEYYKKVIDRGVEMGKTIAFDPAQELKYIYEPDIFEDMLARTDYFFCNEEELDVAMRYMDVDEAEKLLDYVDVLIVTKGGAGSVLYRDGKEIEIHPYKPKKVVDPTGAGDAYRAGFYAGLSRGYDLGVCCRFASARASYALEYHGPQEVAVGWQDVLDRFEEL